ncbi:MAG: DUF1403 family protein, partial [Alphaproteobacteria bacterium]|nr:DUF1403 family protein [Alphaproteobacteria bacterium]
AYGRAARRARALDDDLGGRARRLLAIRERLRAKAAPAVLDALLGHDALSPATIRRHVAAPIGERAARRLFDRLVALGVVRELTGRASHRFYGL